MPMTTTQALFESSVSRTVLSSPINAPWVAVLKETWSPALGLLERRYYGALRHCRSQKRRPPLPGAQVFDVGTEGEARQQALEMMIERRDAEKVDASQDEPAVFVDPLWSKESWPAFVKNKKLMPPPLHVLLGGRGRPPISGLAMMRAFLVAPLLRISASAASIAVLLHSNPVFASLCGFQGYAISAGRGELINYAVPSESTLAEFNHVMTYYGLWRSGCVETVTDNLRSGVVAVEAGVSFDTAHVVARSGSVGVKVRDNKGKITIKRICRLTKPCACGKARWPLCPHPWCRTDDGAAVVVKGPTKKYWAHKVSVAAFAKSEVPIDARVMQHAADHDSKTVVPHLRELMKAYPDFLDALKYVLADTAYHSKTAEVAKLGPRLLTPAKASRSKKTAAVADRLSGIDHFTGTGIPVCEMDVKFVLVGRDIAGQRYIWKVPDDDGGSPCLDCERAALCGQGGAGRYIRVDRKAFPQINWDNPQHLQSNRELYQQRTGVERAIKRLKVDLGAEHITQRNALRVQAVIDTKMMTLHLLLRAQARAA